ncbi:MAG: class I SAM-dependent methyltransferase [Desulfobacterales bacterium]|nr:class I SAM-dependent methyltransferase [Desulfobacterales bacterium]
MSDQSSKYQKQKDSSLLNTHDVGVNLPMNTKYLSGNPLSRLLIRRFLSAIISMISSNALPRNKILDVGCGEGIIPRQLLSLWPSVVLHGLDIAPELLKVAQKLVPGMGCFAGSIDALPLPDRTYDLVCCTEVLEHLERPKSALSEIMRVGKKHFLFSVPNEPWWRIANMIRGAYWPEWGNTPGHLNHWNTERFVRLLSNYSEVVVVKRPFPWTLVLCRKK